MAPIVHLSALTNYCQNWFQNRRAKAKQLKRQEEFERSQAKEKADKEAAEQKALKTDNSNSNNNSNGNKGNPDQADDDDDDDDDENGDKALPGRSQSIDQCSASQNLQSDTPADQQQETSTQVSCQQPQQQLLQLHQQQPPRQQSQSPPQPQPSAHVSPPAEDLAQSNAADIPPFANWGGFGGLDQLLPPGSLSQLEHTPPLEHPQSIDQTQAFAPYNFDPYTADLTGIAPNTNLTVPCSPLDRRSSASSDRSDMSSTVSSVAINPTPIQTPMPPPSVDSTLNWQRTGKVDIAARRKRPRPAAIGTSGLSRSLGAPHTVSPTRLSHGGQALRQVKSSANLRVSTGPRYPGIRKVSSAQRSPLGLSTFAEAELLNAAQQPDLSSHPAMTTDTLAPPTPVSAGYTPSFSHSAGEYMSPANGSDTYYPVGLSTQLNESPPTTPFGFDSSTYCQALAPPKSAPPFSTTFQHSPFIQSPLAWPCPDTSASGILDPFSLPQPIQIPQPMHVSPLPYDTDALEGAGDTLSSDLPSSASPGHSVISGQSPPSLQQEMYMQQPFMVAHGA